MTRSQNTEGYTASEEVANFTLPSRKVEVYGFVSVLSVAQQCKLIKPIIVHPQRSGFVTVSSMCTVVECNIMMKLLLAQLSHGRGVP